MQRHDDAASGAAGGRNGALPFAFFERLARLGIDRRLLEKAAPAFTRRQTFARGTHLIREGEPTEQIFFVDEGWLAVQESSPGGTLFNRAVHLAGDIAGLTELAWTPATSDLVCLTAGSARVLSRSELDALVRRNPRLGSLLLTISVVQQTAMSDRHAHALRSDGRARVLYLLLDLHARQAITGAGEWLSMPLTQTDIANAVGLSNVHVNGMLRQLEEEGAIERGRGRIRLADPEGLARETGYRARWSNVDFGWMAGLERMAAPPGTEAAPGRPAS